ncbi:putative sensory transducer protein YvaQ [Sporosarcina sp. NCCP-2716]|uniref:methyl-accepting chemotaxis protein n=1 Tax=Sporosarcina sp. NCCP-2716 TaxID=2943679 RepID=UPI00203E632C|nr:methyl-accepting chemotaxis protein [Sporosarcina sp. NCCP-2716]GKV69228.1 putative sensory transducer protein YvaQ [Sporosarcina sp. NCCP-2716]
MKRVRGFKSVKSRLLTAFGAVVVLVAALGIYTLVSVNAVNNKTNEIVETDTKLMAVDLKLANTMAGRLSAVRAYVLFGDEKYKKEFLDLTEQGIALQAEAEKIGSSGEFGELVDQMINWRKKLTVDVIDMYDQNRPERAAKNLETLSVEGNKLIGEYHKIAEKREQLTQTHGQEIIRSGEETLTWISVVVLLVLVVSTAAALFTARIITLPIKRVMERMKSIADGDLSHEPLAVNSRDEVGQLAAATNEMSARTREMLNEINGVSSSVSAHSEELTQSSNEVNAASRQIAVTMQELTSGIESEANTATDLAMVMERFAERVGDANARGEAIQEASHNVLGQTVNGSELMAVSAEQMQRIDGIVQEAVAKIKGLDVQSQEISKLVVVIKDIADQTNLLALNAAIEAARAGEHGKGFAVVAEEVRKLAEQVAVSVTDITGIVGTIQHESSSVAGSLEAGYAEVEKGTTQLKTTQATFEEIRQAVEHMADDIGVISQSLEDITAGSEEMSESIEEIAAISEQSAAGVQETSAASQQTSSSMEEVAGSSAQLAQLAEDLNGLVRAFKL